MSFVLSVQDFRFQAEGAELSVSLRSGQVLAVFGRAGAGKSRFLRAVCGGEKGRKGTVRRSGEAVLAGDPVPAKRSTPESIARRAAGRSAAGRVAEALAATQLWDVRRTLISSLSPDAQAACELLPALAGPFRLIGIDGQLERLDPWARSDVMELLGKRLSQGAAAVIATNLAELAPKADVVAIWKGGSPIYAGTYAELERRAGPTKLEIETLHEPSARALCDPFEVRIQSKDGVLTVQAKDGQVLAARMVLDGYGDVRAVVHRPPTPAEVLGEL